MLQNPMSAATQTTNTCHHLSKHTARKEMMMSCSQSTDFSGSKDRWADDEVMKCDLD